MNAQKKRVNFPEAVFTGWSVRRWSGQAQLRWLGWSLDPVGAAGDCKAVGETVGTGVAGALGGGDAGTDVSVMETCQRSS